MKKNDVLLILQKINASVPCDTDIDLLKSGIIDSFDIACIVSAFNESFGIEIDPAEIIPENFRSVDAMVTMLEKY